jgi:hypothetical protein
MSLFTDDLDIFFAEDGEDVIIAGVTVTALFDTPFELGQQAQETDVPQITVQSADIAGIARPLQEKPVTRVDTGGTFQIITTIDDGKGLTRMELRPT